jgi:hypothetical protein
MECLEYVEYASNEVLQTATRAAESFAADLETNGRQLEKQISTDIA